MIGTGHPTESFRRTEHRPDVARFARAEFGDSGTAWMAVGVPAAKKRRAFAGIGKAWRGFRAVAARISAMLF